MVHFIMYVGTWVTWFSISAAFYCFIHVHLLRALVFLPISLLYICKYTFIYVLYYFFITLCAYVQQGYAFGRISLCTNICIYLYVSHQKTV